MMVVIGLLPMSRVDGQVGRAMPALPSEVNEKGQTADALDLYLHGRRADAIERIRPEMDRGNGDALYLFAFSLETPEPAKASRGAALDYYYRLAENAGHREASLRRLLIELAAPDKERVEKARVKLEEAANTGAFAAGRILGEAWLRGLMGFKPDFDEGERAWLRAAESGDAAAFVLLARLYRGEFGFPERRSAEKTIENYRKAAAKGAVDAFLPLASSLMKCSREEKDQREGREWLSKAQDRNLAEAWLLAGELSEKDDPPAALENYRLGADRGSADCMLRLAKYEFDRKEGDIAAGLEWLEKAVKTGSPAALAEKGGRLLKGGDTSDVGTAYRLLLAAAMNDWGPAQYDLGMLYLSGRLGIADPAAAVIWLTKAMETGDAEAQYQLGLLNEKGIGTPINYANAGVLYTMASTKGHAIAPARIARMAVEGLGTKRNLPHAWAYATLALERGDSSVKKLQTEVAAQLDESQKAEGESALAKLRSLKPASVLKEQ